MIPIPSYNQADAKWKDILIGKSGLTMHGYGCYITTIAAILAGAYQKKNSSGQPITPGDLCNSLNAIGGFSADGQVDWSSIQKLYPDCFLYKACWSTNVIDRYTVKVDINKVLSDVERAVRFGLPVLLCVDNILKDKIPDHAICLYDAPTDRTQWKIMDPDGGKQILFKDKYGTVENGVYGYRLLLGSPVCFPDYSTDLDKDVGIACWKAGQIFQGKNTQTYSKELLDTILSV